MCGESLREMVERSLRSYAQATSSGERLPEWPEWIDCQQEFCCQWDALR